MTEDRSSDARHLPRVPGIIRFLRDNFLRDGAEGDSVHALCDAAEYLLEQRARLVLDLRRLRTRLDALLTELDDPSGRWSSLTVARRSRLEQDALDCLDAWLDSPLSATAATRLLDAARRLRAERYPAASPGHGIKE